MVALLAVTVGLGDTVTVSVLIADVQLPFDPVMVYTVVTPGLRVCVAPESDPGCQVYDVAPDAVTTVEPPEHKFADDIEETVGVVFTVSVAEVVAEHSPLEPVTVYTVVTRGDTEIVAVFIPPGFHV